ncbi:uncharacterized protein DS421_5g149600 [Arachis hypogaea]|nr:uncharacterized protein DS421_5g149600 [Arachis hypogaea]
MEREDVLLRSSDESREASMALPTVTYNSNGTTLVRRRTPLFVAPWWHDVAAVELGENTINAPVSALTGWKLCGDLKRAMVAGWCPDVVGGGVAFVDGGGERHAMNLVVWCCRGWFWSSVAMKQ